MEIAENLACFISEIETDMRIGATHISLYVALLYYDKNADAALPISIERSELMQKAKISSASTYYKCMKQLDEYGYIVYIPSYKKNRASRVCLLRK